MKMNVSKVKQFLLATGLYDLPREEAIERQRNQLAEEMCEFWIAWKDNNKLEMLDAIADIEFVSESLYELNWHLSGYNFKIVTRSINTIKEYSEFTKEQTDEAFNRVCENNLSKFDDTLEDALLTQTKYDKLNINTRYTSIAGKYITRSIDTGTYGKILKSHKFKPVILEDLL